MKTRIMPYDEFIRRGGKTGWVEWYPPNKLVIYETKRRVKTFINERLVTDVIELEEVGERCIVPPYGWPLHGPSPTEKAFIEHAYEEARNDDHGDD